MGADSYQTSSPCASELRANKLSDVTERVDHFYDHIAITGSSHVAIRVMTDQISDSDTISRAALYDGHL